MRKKPIPFCSCVLIFSFVCTISFAQDFTFRPLRFYRYPASPAAPHLFSAENGPEEKDFPLFVGIGGHLFGIASALVYHFITH
jgi:hypothetical protein